MRSGKAFDEGISFTDCISNHSSTMNSRSLNRPPRSPYNKKEGLDDPPLDKRRKIVGGRIATSLSTGRGRRAFAVITNSPSIPENMDAGASERPESIPIEFSKEEVEALLNDRVKSKKFDHKAKIDQMTEHIRKLRLCIKWFQDLDETHVRDLENVRNNLQISEKRCSDTEIEMKTKIEEYNSVVSELRITILTLEERVTKEESDKKDAIESYNRERDARIAAETQQASLSQELAKSQEENTAAKQKVDSVNDMYKRLQEYNTSLQHYNSKLQTELAAANESLKRVEKEKLAIVENLSTLRGHQNSLQDQIISLKALQSEATKQKETMAHEVSCLRGELQQVRDDRDRHMQQVQSLADEVLKYKESTGKSSIELENLSSKATALEMMCSSQRDQIEVLQHQLAAANEKLKLADLSASDRIAEFERHKNTVRELEDRLADAELQIVEGEKLRKKLHNTILELKGNIRVFCRVRPLLPEESGGAETSVVSYPSSTEYKGRGIDLSQTGQKYPFTFDKVFSHDALQQDVFVEISQLVQSALDGYKVCIFAYGQTGSGKTYTMMGRPEISDQKGLIPRSLEQIFQTSQSLSSQGWKYKLQASMLEIYNETIRDLISSGVRLENGAPAKQYSIKHDANGNTYVSDLTIVDVSSINEVSSLLSQAAQSRSVGKTQMNEQSSRSHFVFTLRISGLNENTEQQVHGVLNLIDLAGSERLSRSGATGDRLKETQAINKSLSSLSDVIFALAKKEDHVPFRNSKLTYLLQPCLGGDSKTLMFVNISPDSSSVGESLCSLRFAARVNACEIGIPRRQTTARLPDSRLSSG